MTGLTPRRTISPERSPGCLFRPTSPSILPPQGTIQTVNLPDLTALRGIVDVRCPLIQDGSHAPTLTSRPLSGRKNAGMLSGLNYLLSIISYL